jgi:hypothetical protein
VILDRLRDFIVATSVPGSEGMAGAHLARYPSPEWNLKSWSYRLVEDLVLKRALHRSRLADGFDWKLRITDRLTESAWSYHQDASYKALLYSALLRESRREARTLVLPEVGPFGFDLLVGRCAGFTRFVAYDKDAATVDACRAFYRGVDAAYEVSPSATFDFTRFATPDHVIVFPDWPHDDLEKRLAGLDNVVRYSARKEALRLGQLQRRLGVARLDWKGLFAAMERLE